ncbi:MAG TPA: trehalase family glycosidase [Candidatus Limnocylindria bacterium]|nr:trehalase family glycosidase [Candidatus Limnocylindria bacterium]
MDEKQTTDNLLEAAKTVLELNDRGIYTAPANSHLYPHQWLWDSCFVAIGRRHYDVDRAKTEILSLLAGQWANGMMPNMILSGGRHDRDANIWRSWLNPNAPDDLSTSGITQPPIVAEAVVRIGEKLTKPERRSWYLAVFPALLAYHQWLYTERDPHGEGLVLLVHPWETGLDNTPPWVSELEDHQMPLWIQAVGKLKLSPIINFFRRDTKLIPAEQRMRTIDALALYSTQRRLRRKNYDIKRILSHSLFAIEDVSFNAIFIRANQHLVQIAKTIRKELPEDLLTRMKKTEQTFEGLWDPYTSQYYSREFVSHRLLKVPSIGTLMPLYAGSVTKERAKQLVKLLEDEHQFGAHYPVPSAPLNSSYFNPHCYWQGPSWVNTNWLIIDGLRRYGFEDHAAALTESTIEMVKQSGFYEYFSPLDGSPSGAENFSWTAALTIDLLAHLPDQKPDQK